MKLKEKLFMGIDIGTSGVRAAVFDIEGKQLSLAYRESPMLCHETGMGELDPELVYRSFLDVMKECAQAPGVDSRNLAAAALSTQLFSILAVDRKGVPITNILTWADIRSLGHAELVKNNFDYRKIYDSTGCRGQHPMYPLSKILWIKETMPDIFKKAFKFVSVKEHILNRLFGKFVIDITDASTTAMFNIHNFSWDEYVLEKVIGIDKSRLGQSVECNFILQGMRKEYAAETGLDPDLPFAVGSGDGMLANVGCGVFDDTSMSCTIGTSGALRTSVSTPLLDPQHRTWCYCFTKDTWVIGGAINNGGIVLKWLRDEFKDQFEKDAGTAGLKNIYELFSQYAEEINPGSDGLVFLPFLTGERSPGWNANAVGTIHGLRLMHGRKHIVRAAMEAVMFRMFSVFEILHELSGNTKRIIANGGYVKSKIWLKMQADIFGKEIAVAGASEAAVFGAAYLAMFAVGAIDSLTTPLLPMRTSEIIVPSQQNHLIYKELYSNFKSLYGKLSQ